jgi:hypothetical protein
VSIPHPPRNRAPKMRVTLGHKARYHFSETADMERSEYLLSLFGGLPGNDAAHVGNIPPELADHIASHTVKVVVSRSTMMKTKGKHTEILYSDLELIPHGFATGRVQLDSRGHLIFLFRDPRNGSRTLKVVVKPTPTREELFLTTYHVCTRRQLRTTLKRGNILRDDGTWV